MDKGFGWTLGAGDGQEGLVCCGSWGHKESDTTEQLNRTEEKKDMKDEHKVSKDKDIDIQFLFGLVFLFAK